MKEHPILFSGEMIRALLADRKRVTRRLSKRWLKVKAGDRLWVRETWGIWDRYMTREESIDAGVPSAPHALDADNAPEYWKKRVIFRVDGEPDPCNRWHWHPSIHMPRWASRILLECEEDARLERLWDITEEECLLEGVLPMVVTQEDISAAQEGYGDAVAKLARALGPGQFTAKCEFMQLWSELHTKPGERWDDNPEVVRVGRFRRIA